MTGRMVHDVMHSFADVADVLGAVRDTLRAIPTTYTIDRPHRADDTQRAIIDDAIIRCVHELTIACNAATVIADQPVQVTP